MRVIALSAIILAGCGASAEIRTRCATEVSHCIANERAIVDRQGGRCHGAVEQTRR